MQRAKTGSEMDEDVEPDGRDNFVGRLTDGQCARTRVGQATCILVIILAFGAVVSLWLQRFQIGVVVALARTSRCRSARAPDAVAIVARVAPEPLVRRLYAVRVGDDVDRIVHGAQPRKPPHARLVVAARSGAHVLEIVLADPSGERRGPGRHGEVAHADDDKKR